jgi:hypothetical protein
MEHPSSSTNNNSKVDTMTDEQTKANSDIPTTTEGNEIVGLTDKNTMYYSLSDHSVLEQNLF